MARIKLKDVAEATFAFRIGKDQKEKLDRAICLKRTQINKKLSEDEYRVTKNEIILTAINLGLKELKLEDLPKRQKKKNQP